MCTLVKISEFLRRGFYRCRKQLKIGTFEGVCDMATAKMAQFQAMGIVLGDESTFQGCAFCEFWWGTYGLGAISPRKQQISSFSARRLKKVWRVLPSRLYCSVSPRHTATHVVYLFITQKQQTHEAQIHKANKQRTGCEAPLFEGGGSLWAQFQMEGGVAHHRLLVSEN